MEEYKTLMKNIPAWLLTVFVVSVVMMNLLANKSIDTGVEWLALDCGIIVSWVAFLAMDVIVQRFGAKASIQVSLTAIAFNLVVALFFYAAAKISGNWGESYVEHGEIVNTALDNTFKGTWFIIAGSTVAFIVSSIANALFNVGIGSVFGDSGSFADYARRSYFSTIAAQFIDNLTFALIVSHTFFGWTMTQCLSCAATGAIAELLCEMLFSVFGYKILQSWKKNGVGSEYLDYKEGHDAEHAEPEAASA